MSTYKDYNDFGRAFGSIKVKDALWLDIGTLKLDLGSDATGDIIYRNSSGFYTRLPVGSNGNVLTLASGIPSWAAPTGGGISGIIFQDEGSTVVTATTVNFVGAGVALTNVSGVATVTVSGGGGGGTPGGSNRQIQYNNSGAFGADSNLVWTSGNRLLVDITDQGAYALQVGGSAYLKYDTTNSWTYDGSIGQVILQSDQPSAGFIINRTFGASFGLSMIDSSGGSVKIGSYAGTGFGPYVQFKPDGSIRNYALIESKATDSADTRGTLHLDNLSLVNATLTSKPLLTVANNDVIKFKILPNGDIVLVNLASGVTPTTQSGTVHVLTVDANGLLGHQAGGGGGGITTLNTLTGATQTFATGTSGTDFGIVSSGTTHTFNLPTASASNRGLLSSANWSTFNGKQDAITLTTTGTSGAATFVGNTLNIPQYSGGGGTPGGSDRQVQFNNSGAFGGDSGLIYNSSGELLVGLSDAGAYKLQVGGSFYFKYSTTESLTYDGSIGQLILDSAQSTAGFFISRAFGASFGLQFLDTSGGSIKIGGYGATGFGPYIALKPDGSTRNYSLIESKATDNSETRGALHLDNVALAGGSLTVKPLVTIANNDTIKFKVSAIGDLVAVNLGSGVTPTTQSGTVHLLTSDANGLFGHYALGNGLVASSNTLSSKYQVLSVNTTAVGNVGTGEDDLMTYTLPAGKLGTNNDFLEVDFNFDLAINSNSKTITFYFGSSVLTLPVNNAAGGGVDLRMTVVRTGATSQLVTFHVVTLNNGVAAYNFTASQTLSGTVVIKATGTATADNDIVQKLMIVKYFGI